MMVDGLDIPTPLAALILVGALALAVSNINKVLHLLRIPQAIGKVVSWLAKIARDAFIQGASEGIAEIVRQELYPNGGDNIRDVADRTEALAMRNVQQIQGLSDELEQHRADDSAHRRIYDHVHDPEAHDKRRSE